MTAPQLLVTMLARTMMPRARTKNPLHPSSPAAPRACVPALSNASAGAGCGLLMLRATYFCTRNIVESMIASEFQRVGFAGFDSPNTLEVPLRRRRISSNLMRIADALSHRAFFHISSARRIPRSHVCDRMVAMRRTSHLINRHEFAGKNPERPSLHTLQVRIHAAFACDLFTICVFCSSSQS